MNIVISENPSELDKVNLRILQIIVLTGPTRMENPRNELAALFGVIVDRIDEINRPERTRAGQSAMIARITKMLDAEFGDDFRKGME